MANSRKKPAALVTGAARRIGRAIAADLAAHGWAVAIHYNTSRREADEAVEEIRAGGGEAVAVKADLGDLPDLDRLIEETAARLGPVTCLVNNASLFEYDEVSSLSGEGWQAHIDVNLRAPVFLARKFAELLPHNTTGSVINVLDQRVENLNPKFFSYTISKSALWTATRTLAQGLAPRIRVNAVAPGPTLRSSRQSEADFARQNAATPLGRGAGPEEIAAAVRFILDAPSLTGQMIALDGGQHLIWQTPDVVGIEE